MFLPADRPCLGFSLLTLSLHVSVPTVVILRSLGKMVSSACALASPSHAWCLPGLALMMPLPLDLREVGEAHGLQVPSFPRPSLAGHGLCVLWEVLIVDG